jgi:NADP-dependent 3-hydroxy acid dehydrogenase YdfG
LALVTGTTSGIGAALAKQLLLVAPEVPAAEIVEFLEADGRTRFTERRRGG